MTTKTKTTASKKHPAAQAEKAEPAHAQLAPAKTPPAQAPPPPPAEPAASAEAAASDAPSEKADTSPDASIEVLALHSERLVETTLAHAGPLKLAKIGDADRAELTGRVATLRAAEAAWKKARAAGTPGAVTDARDELTRGRRDLHGGLRVYAKDKDTQDALDGVGGVDDDDDLVADVEVLLPLARARAAQLAGTEITPAVVDGVEAKLADFRAARVGLRAAAADPTTAQKLAQQALAAHRARNEAFWALSELNRDVSGRARFRFRDDEKLRALFGNYSADRPGARKSAPAAEPPPPAPAKPTLAEPVPAKPAT